MERSELFSIIYIRFEFGKNSSWVPAPNKYNLKGEIDDSLDKKKGF